MPLRKTLLLVMLGALGIAGMAGAGAILYSTGSGTWQIAVSGILAAIAVGLMLPCTLLIDQKRWRATGLAGMGAILATFFAALAATWLVSATGFSYASYRYRDALALSPWIVLYHGIFMTLGSAWIGAVWGRYAGWTLVIFAAASCLLTLGILWADVLIDPSSSSAASFMVVAAVHVFGLTTTANLFFWGTPERRGWSIIGMVASVTGLVATFFVAAKISGSPTYDRGDYFLSHGFVPLAAVAGWVGFANVARLGKLLGPQVYIRWATVGAAFCVAAALIAANYRDYASSPPREFYYRLAGAAFLFTACGVLAMIVTARLNRKINADDRNAASGLVDIQLICPRCQRQQILAIGKNHCAACGLRITLDIEEPRCAKCDYLLYRLTTNRCPECGTEVAGMAELGAAV